MSAPVAFMHETTDDIEDAVSGMTEAEAAVPDDDFRTLAQREDHDDDDPLPNQ